MAETVWRVRMNGSSQRRAVFMIRNYGIALSSVGIALGCTLLMQRFLPYPMLFLFFAAVMVSAWFGAGPGLAAVFASTVAVDYFFVQPVRSLAINATDTAYFASFVICALAASWVSWAKREDEEALREARDKLEIRVAERTAELQKSNRELQASIEQHDSARKALMKTQAELAELSRFLTMAELTASIAHEVNQPLTAVVVYGRACLEWLLATPPNIEEARRSAESIIQDGTRAGNVLNRIRGLFRRRPSTQEWVDLNEVIRQAVGFVNEEAVRNNVTMKTEVPANPLRVKGDPVQLQQVVLNLIINAIDALREANGRREIVIQSRETEASEAAISVEDNGKGISDEIAQKIFDPFFTTKVNGIGMGLAISRSIVESHGGQLWARRREPNGARFEFTIKI